METKISMDPALSSQAPTNEFGYCPRTPIYNVVNERPQISIEVREVCCGQSQSSPPTRKKSRFFDTLRLKSPRKANVADENGSPQSLKKRKSIADIFPFSSTRSRKPPDSDHIYHSFRTKRSRTASPSKQRAVLKDASCSRLNRRKSLGEIWGSISSKVSPRRGAMPLQSSARITTPFYGDKFDLNTCMSGALGPVTRESPIQMNEWAASKVSGPLARSVDSGVDMDRKHPQTPRKPSVSSSMLWYEESPRTSTPINRDESKTPNSYLNLLIASHNDSGNTSEPKTPDSYLQQLLEAHNAWVDGTARGTPVSNLNLNLSQEQSPFWGNSTQVEPSEDEEEFSLPPPYILDHFSDVEMGEVELREDSQLEQSTNSGIRAILPEVNVREVDPLEESPNIDKVFHLRGGDRSRRYQKLMARPGLSQQSTNERIEKSIKLTVAKMTKNFHMVTSSEECSEGASAMRDFNEYSFETDQMEVWDSIIMGTRTLQQATPFQPLRSIPSWDKLQLCNLSEEQVLQESIELRKLPEEVPIESILDDADVVPELATSLISGKLQRTHSSLQRKRETSATMVRVEFPKTVNLGAHAEIYESKSKAIAALYEYKLSELSNFCTYDPSTHTIFAHALESSVPNPAVLKQAGLDVLWLPMQKDIALFIQMKEETQDKAELPLTKSNSSLPAGEETNLKVTQESPGSNDSGHSLNPDTLSAHNDEMVAANVYNLDRHRSQFELEAEFIDPVEQSPRSSLEVDRANPEHDERLSIFDDDFFLEADPEMARNFLGSQYSEVSQSSSSNGNRLSPSDLLGMDSTRELLWSLDENEEVKPVKTWVELGREYLAEHSAQTVRASDDIHEVMDAYSEYPAPRSDKKSSRKSSSVIPYTEHIEDIGIFEKGRSLKQQFARRSSLSSILADDIGFRRPKRKRCRSGSKSPLSESKKTSVHPENTVDLVFMKAKTPKIPKMDSGGLQEPLDVKDNSGCEVSEIPFPNQEFRNVSSPHSCFSYTSYIEAERARERLYQTFPSVASVKIEAESEDCKAVTKVLRESKHSAGTMECSSELIEPEARALEIAGPQLQYQDGEPNLEEKKTWSEGAGEPINSRQSSVLSLASGFRSTNYSKQMACEECPGGKEMRNYSASEDSNEHTDWRRCSIISLASGFKFTKYSKEMTIEDGGYEAEEIPNTSASMDSASTIDSPSLEAILDNEIPASNDGLTGSRNGDSRRVKCDQALEVPGTVELAYDISRVIDLSHFPRDSYQNRSTSWKTAMEDLNIRAVGKAACQDSPVKQEGNKVGALIDIFQARGLMQSIKPALHRKHSPAPFLHRSGGRPATPTARIITPSGGVFHPAGAVCVAAGHALSTSPIKRVPIPRSPIVRPSSGLSSVDTDVSSTFGEKLERAEKHSEGDEESDPTEEI